MAINKKITDLNAYPIAAPSDVFALVDVGISETKKIEVSDLMASPGPIGSLNPNTGEFSVLTLGGNPVAEFSTDGTLSGDSDTVVPTEKAVKSYVDTAVSDAVQLNIRYASSDSTAEIGDAVLVDTGSGDVNLTISPTKEGKIYVKKTSGDGNKVYVTTTSGTIDGEVTNDDLDFQYKTLSLLCDGVDFYIV
jgi:hypothetical protein